MKRALLAAVVLAGLGAAACGPDYDRTEITGIVAGTPGGSIDIGRVVVPEGTLVKAHIVSYDTDHKVMTAHVRSADTSVLDVSPVVSADDYAFLGLRTGSTTVEIKADDKTVLVIEALVTAQPPLP